MTIGERIKKRREELNISQDELAEKLGYKTRSSILKLEKDRAKPNPAKIKLLCQVLKTTPSYIMGWVDEWEEQHDLYENLADEAKAYDAISQAFGEEICTILNDFLRLDEIDRAKITERIDTLLSAEKYSV